MNERPIRILRIIARLNIGGPAIHVTLLTAKLGLPDYESALVSGSIAPGEGDMAYYAEERGVHAHLIPELGRAIHPLRDIRTVLKLYRLMQEFKPDVVHTHTAKAGFLGRVAARMAGVPVIVHTFHGHVFKGYFGPTMTHLFIRLERLGAQLSDRLIALTEGLRRELVEQYRIAPKGKIIVLPLGLDLDSFAQTPRKSGAFRAAWDIAPDVPLIGIVGRLTQVKNHALFLQSAAQIKPNQPDAHFVIVGDGELRADIEGQANALGLRGAVTFTGWQRDLAPIYSDLDVLVISSVNEGTPVTVIEALSAACPVVTTRVGGLPDLLDGGALGTLVPSEDADALAKGILDTLRQPPDVSEAQRLMLDRYGIDRLVRDLDSLYRGLLAKKGRQQ